MKAIMSLMIFTATLASASFIQDDPIRHIDYLCVVANQSGVSYRHMCEEDEDLARAEEERRRRESEDQYEHDHTQV